LSGFELLGKSKINDYNNSLQQAASALGLPLFMQSLQTVDFKKIISFLTVPKDNFSDSLKRNAAYNNLKALLDLGSLPIITGNALDTPYDEDILAADLAVLLEA